MSDRDATQWSVIRGAAAGRAREREVFARTYEAVIRAYLGARWRHSPLLAEIDDSVQETFLACFRENGALARAEPGRPGGFRAYLYGITRNVARRAEERWGRRERPAGSDLALERIAGREASLTAIFDRAWALAVLREALRRHERRAAEEGPDALRRLELLRLRFRDGLPIRKIAERWKEDPARVHRLYAKARREFAATLFAVVGEHAPGTRAEVERECARLAHHLP